MIEFLEKLLEKFYYDKKVHMSFKSVFDPLSIDIQNSLKAEKNFLIPRTLEGGTAVGS